MIIKVHSGIFKDEFEDLIKFASDNPNLVVLLRSEYLVFLFNDEYIKVRKDLKESFVNLLKTTKLMKLSVKVKETALFDIYKFRTESSVQEVDALIRVYSEVEPVAEEPVNETVLDNQADHSKDEKKKKKKKKKKKTTQKMEKEESSADKKETKAKTKRTTRKKRKED